MAKEEIHPAIKEALGYSPDEPDALVYADWKQRKTRVCKPCWELKYCPYGPLVEQSPTLPSERSGAMEHAGALKKALDNGYHGSECALTDDRRAELEVWIADDELILRQAVHEVRDRHRLDEIAKLPTDIERLDAFHGGPLPPIHIYRVEFDFSDTEITEQDISPEFREEVLAEAAAIKKRYLDALKTGIEDNRRLIHPVRKLWLEFLINRDFDSLPESIPDTFTDAVCNIFGHVCPVFFAAEVSTETSTERRRGRYIPFDVKMRVVRRDNYTCQHCSKHLKDDEVEFDHIIPIAKGGSSEEHNIRLTCFDCNRDKGDEYVP